MGIFGRQRQPGRVLQAAALEQVRDATVQVPRRAFAADRRESVETARVGVAQRGYLFGEEFRVRLSFNRLKLKSVWRVQKIEYNPIERITHSSWDE